MIPAINDPQLRASAEALSPRYRPSIDEMLADLRALEQWLNACRVRIRARISTPDGIDLHWQWGADGWLVIVEADGVKQALLIAPSRLLAAAFPHLVDLVRLIGELAREAGE